MKSVGGLFDRIAEPGNLRDALARAARGKRHRPAVAHFVAHLELELWRLSEELLNGTYRPGPYTQFTVTDPKPRRISCADFRDRVIHHALCAVIGPVIERRFIADSYACRRDLGSHRAILRAQHLTRRFPYYLKTDIRRFYDSVHHDRLLHLLARLFRERPLLSLLETIIRRPVPGQAPGRGLPIGNLTSQWLANLYLDRLDHFVRDQLAVPGYARYMDDLVLWANDKAALWLWRRQIESFLGSQLAIELNQPRTVLAPVTEGVPFLGYRIYRRLLRRQGPRLRRTRRLLQQREAQFLAGEMSAKQLVASVRSLAGPRRFFGTGEPIHSTLDL